MLTISLPTTGIDPDCGFARDFPGLHACTDRDGLPVAGAKACFAWARHCLAAEVPTCPGCARPIYQQAEIALVRSGRYVAKPAYEVVDPTWRHLGDGTVALSPAGELSCAAVAA